MKTFLQGDILTAEDLNANFAEAAASGGGTGYTGSVGFKGSSGNVGYQGSAGSAGTGYSGSVGYQGSVGVVGYTGSAGVGTGYQGSLGDTGYTGSIGSTGYQGSLGNTGYQGSLGITGYTGSIGSTGYQGSQGSSGYQGSLGNTGYTGSIGSTGYQGSQGETGYKGSTGDIPVAGNNTEILFNDSGNVSSNLNFTFDKNNLILAVNNIHANTITLPANGYIDFNTSTYKPSFQSGRLYYDNEEKTWVGYGDGTEFEISLGQREWVRCRNSSGATIYKGQPVYVTGVHIPGNPVHGHHPTVALADASDVVKKDVLGLAGEDILDGNHGYVVVRGYIEGLDTSALTSGQRIHLGFSAPGVLQTIAPEYPNWPMDVGLCLTSNSTVGTIYVNINDHSVERFRVAYDAVIGGDLTVENNLYVGGNVTTTSAVNLNVDSNLIYLGGGDTIANTNFTGSGLNDANFRGVYEGSGSTSYYVKIDTTGVPDKFSWSFANNFSIIEAANVAITGSRQALANGISIEFSANTGHTLNDVWYGTASPINVDLGLVGNYNDSSYKHAGFFRDASDGYWKVFDSYTPEPSAAVDIDTSNNTFRIADFQANIVAAASVTIGGDPVVSNTYATDTFISNTYALSGSLVLGNTYIGNSSYGAIWMGDAAKTSARRLSLWTDYDRNASFISIDNRTAYLNVALTAARGHYGTYISANNYSEQLNSAGTTRYNSGIYGNQTVIRNSDAAQFSNAYLSYAYTYSSVIYNYANGTSNSQITTASGYRSVISTYSSGKIVSAYGFYTTIAPGDATVTGNIETARGLYVGIGTNNSAANVGTGYILQGTYPSAANINQRNGIHLTNESNNYFSANVSIGGFLKPSKAFLGIPQVAANTNGSNYTVYAEGGYGFSIHSFTISVGDTVTVEDGATWKIV